MCQALNQNPWSKILVLGSAVCHDENEMSFLLKDDLTEWENQEDVTDICESDADCPLSQYCYQNLYHVCPEQMEQLPQSECALCGGSRIEGMCEQKCTANQMIYYNVDGSGDLDLKGEPKCSLCNFSWLYTTKDECAKCQRQKPGSFMAIKWQRETFNVCMPCAYNSLPCVTTLEECQNCPNRYWIPEM